MDTTQRKPLVANRTRVILRAPFTADTWKRVGYIALALPVGILCVPIALVGGPAGRIQRVLAERLLGVDADGPERTGPLALAHALISLPINLVALTVTFYFWTVVAINLGFPLRPDNDPTQSWEAPPWPGPGPCTPSAAACPSCSSRPGSARDSRSCRRGWSRASSAGTAAGCRGVSG